jgi:hypothetical protein
MYSAREGFVEWKRRSMIDRTVAELKEEHAAVQPR